MPPEDPEIERWARQLSGEESAGAAAEVTALRAAILAQDEAVDAAAAADDLARARLMKRLENDGLFADPEAATATKIRHARGWQVWLGAAAAVVVVAVGARFVLPPGGSDTQITDRGIAGSVTITSKQPELAAREVLRELEAQGLEPHRLSDAGRVILEVEVTDENLEIFYQWARARNARAVTAGTYRIFVDPAGRD